MFLCMAVSGGAMAENILQVQQGVTYQQALDSIASVTNASLVVGRRLASRLCSRSDAVYYVLTARTWASGRSIIKVKVEDWKLSAKRFLANGEVKDLDMQGFELYVDDRAYFSYKNKCYLFVSGSSSQLNSRSRYHSGISLRDCLLGPLRPVADKLKIPEVPGFFTVHFRICNGNEVVDLGAHKNDWVINEGVLRDKVRTVIQKRSDSEWRSRHVKRLNRKPSVVFGNVNRIICDHKGNFTIPKEAPPTMATNYWQETVYEYHDDGFEQWSVPVGTIEHERVKRLTQRYNYEDLREEAERYLAEMESERLAQPPEVSDSDVDAEIDKGVLLINRLSSSKNRR